MSDETPIFNVYTIHGRGAQIMLPQMHGVEQVRGFAEASAARRSDVLVRAYRVTSESPTGERFEVAFSVLDGEIVQLDSPVIPRAHW